MSSSSTSTFPPFKHVHDQQIRKPCTPRMLLKDFLDENSNSCSSSGFKSFPRQLPVTPIKEFNSNSKPRRSSNSNSNSTTITRKLLRSRSKAATTTISAFHSLMNAVKNIPFTTVKSPSFLPRSLSRRLLQSKKSSSSRSSRKQCQEQVQITVRVKDIIRWTSFLDEKLPPPPPLDYVSSPVHCTTSTTITGSTTTCTTCSSNSSSSNGSSWCDSDFTSEFLPFWSGNTDPDSEEGGKKYSPSVGRDSMEATTGTGNYSAMAPQVEVLLYDEDEQHSPVSVLDFQFGEDEEEEEESFSSTFDQNLANVERTKEMLMQKFQLFESLATLDPVNLDTWISLEERLTNFEEEPEEEDGTEERAMLELLNYVKKSTSSFQDRCEANMEDKLLWDFFREEISAQRNQNDDGFNWEQMVSKAKAWVSGEHNAVEWGQKHSKEACVRDMHKGGRWNKFEYEQEELALEIETAITGFLVDELLVDLLSR